MENDVLSVEINAIRGIGNLKITMPLKPDVYAITGVNGIGKSTLLSCITPRLKRPVAFTSFGKDAAPEAYIKFRIADAEEMWKPYAGEWKCCDSVDLPLRGFQEGSLTNGTRFFNINSAGYRYYSRLLNVDPSLLVPADDFVKENLGELLQNDKRYYADLYRLDRSKAERRYKYKGVVYFLKINNKYVPQFELSTGEFLLINLLHLFNNLLVRTKNVENLNLILIDEIELALHPSAIRRLVFFTQRVACQYHVAIYFSTHSLEIINGLPTDNLFYLHKVKKDSIRCETPCYPAYITRDIYTHSGYDILILVEDDLAKNLVERYIAKNRLDNNKRIQVLPVGGYDNTLDMHQNLIQEKILQPVSHIISIVDGDVESEVTRKRTQENKWSNVPQDLILFLPVESLEKYIKHEIIDEKNYELMRLLRDRLFEFETEVNWFEKEYIENIENKRIADRTKGIADKADSEYFKNGKNLFSILSANFEKQGHGKPEFRKSLCALIIEYLDATDFERELGKSLSSLFK
jgi:hypothetical protein